MHGIRAAAVNADATEIVIIGSQAILGAYPAAPEGLLASVEADVFIVRQCLGGTALESERCRLCEFRLMRLAAENRD